MSRRTKRFIRKTFLYFTVMLAIVLFVLASFQLSLSNPIGMAVMVVTGVYISTFVYANEV
jgi:uncharacterized membrane protein YhaH (DUF805 family)